MKEIEVLGLVIAGIILFFIIGKDVILPLLATAVIIKFGNNFEIKGGAKKCGEVFTDEFQRKLESDLYRVYSILEKNFDKDTIIKMRNEDAKYLPTSQHPLTGYKIRNGICSMEKIGPTYSRYPSKPFEDLINDCLKWCLKNKLPVPDTTIHIYISDRYPFEEHYRNYPIYVVARSANVDLPLIPDHTIRELGFNSLREGELLNWDQAKERINEYKAKTNINKLYFKGVDSTYRCHNLRKIMQDYSKNAPIPIEVDLNALKSFRPVWEFKNYKYLLNLPGFMPWSNRLRYILLMEKPVINVDVQHQSLYPKYTDDFYRQFIDLIVEPNVHYINIPYIWYRASLKNAPVDILEKASKLREEEDKKLIKNIETTYYDLEANPKKYEKMTKLAKKTVEKLTMERIYQYIYKGICLNAELKII